MNLQDVIKKLLLKRGQVSIPYIGGWIIKHTPSYPEPAKGQWQAPSSTIHFNPHLKHPDEEQAEEIATFLNIDPNEAEKKLLTLSDKIQETLNAGDSYIFPGIGTLSKTEGQITFQQADDAITTATSGLKNLTVTPLKKSAPNAITPGPDPSKAPPAPSSSKKDNSQTNVKQTLTKKENNKKKRIFPLILILTALIILSIGLITYLNESDKSDQTTEDYQIKTQQNKEKTPEEEVPKEQEKQKEEITAKQDSLAVEKSKYAHCSNFYIIAGSFKSYNNAQLLSTKLKSKGHNTDILQSKDNYFRVSIHQFNERDQALKKLKELKQNKGHDHLWLLSL